MQLWKQGLKKISVLLLQNEALKPYFNIPTFIMSRTGKDYIFHDRIKGSTDSRHLLDIVEF